MHRAAGVSPSRQITCARSTPSRFDRVDTRRSRQASAASGRSGNNTGISSSSLSFMTTSFRFSWFRRRSEEHTSELQSLMRISYAVFCLKKKKNNNNLYNHSIYDHHTRNTRTRDTYTIKTVLYYLKYESNVI